MRVQKRIITTCFYDKAGSIDHNNYRLKWINVARSSTFHVLFPGTRWIERFAQTSQKRLDAGEVRAAVRNLRTNPELRDGERVQEANELSARKSSARHVGRDDRNAYPGER